MAQADWLGDLCQQTAPPSLTQLSNASQEQLNVALPTLLQCGHAADDGRWLELVKALLNAGADIQQRNEQGRTPLHLALMRLGSGTLEVNVYRDVARLLLARGADPQQTDKNKVTALHLASVEADGLITELLLDLGADPLARNANGHTPLALAAGQPNNFVTFEKLLAAALFQQQQGNAAEQQTAELPVQALAEHAVDIHDHDKLNVLLALDSSLSLPSAALTATLAKALWGGASLTVAQRLVDAGASVPQLHQNGGGDLAWRLASRNQISELDWLLDSGFDINQLPDSGFPALFFASDVASTRLLARGADVTLSSREYGTVAAAIIEPVAPFNQGGGHVLTPAKLRLLLRAGYPVNMTDPQGRTALERAVKGNALWLVKALLDAGADATLNSQGEPSLLPLALSRGRLPLIRTLLKVIPELPQRHPQLLLHYLQHNQPADRVVVEALLVAGVDAEAQDEHGDTALLASARRQQWPLVMLLLRYGANAKAINFQGCTLKCFEWNMPEASSDQLLAWLGRAPQWQVPELNTRPTAFFTLALVPTIILWFLLLALRLYAKRNLLVPTAWFVIAAITAILASAALFYQCDPCLLKNNTLQLAVTATLALLGLLLCAHQWRQRPSRSAT